MSGVETSHLFRTARRNVQPERLDVTRRFDSPIGTPERDMPSRKTKGADSTQNKFAEQKAPGR